eukprot:scpid94367/ scgid25191/ 
MPQVLTFPSGKELEQTMQDFQGLCHLPGIAGALDKTFMRILKPVEHGDTYHCYKGFPAIVLLLCMHARGVIKYINAGRAGCMGDAYTWNTCSLRHGINNGDFLSLDASVNVLNRQVRPYRVADSAFAASPTIIKCVEGDNLNGPQKSFNYAVVRTGRNGGVKNAIRRLNGRGSILVHNFIRNPKFTKHVLLIGATLHSVCEGCLCPFA